MSVRDKNASRSDLPQVLVDAGLALLDEEGAEGLTLRRIAARAGVSHAAPAHHFHGLPGLRNAIAIRGFHDFHCELARVQDASPDNAPAFQRLLTVNLAYIAFARRRAALFRLMFDQLPTQNSHLRENARAAYSILENSCAPFLQGRDAAPMLTSVWALTHGFAMLKMDQPYPVESPVKVSSYSDALRLLVG